jgi:hypothetical protein
LKLSRIDTVIMFPPFLAIFDCISTLYAEYRGFPLEQYETGFFASSFAKAGIFVYYIPVAVTYFALVSMIFYYMKKKRFFLKDSVKNQKLFFALFLIGVYLLPTWQIHTMLSNVLFTTAMQNSLKIVTGLALALIAFVFMILFTKSEIRKLDIER